MCVFVSRPTEIVTWKNGETPKLVVDFSGRNTHSEKHVNRQGFLGKKLQQQRQTLDIFKDFAFVIFLVFSCSSCFFHFSFCSCFSFFLFFFFSFFYVFCFPFLFLFCENLIFWAFLFFSFLLEAPRLLKRSHPRLYYCCLGRRFRMCEVYDHNVQHCTGH